jgi:hypothetical protein
MNAIRRTGLYGALAILGAWSTAGAQAPAARTGAPAARRPYDSAYHRVTSTSPRGYAYATSRAAAAGMSSSAYLEQDPLRPFSAQARQAADAISPTRHSEAPPPPRVQPQARYNYYPGMRGGQHPNGNLAPPHHHCTPSRGGVLSGSLGGGR